MAGHGRSGGEAELTEGSFARCERVTWRVRLRVPVVALRVLGRRGGAFAVEGRHSEVVDPHRSAAGLPGTASCA